MISNECVQASNRYNIVTTNTSEVPGLGLRMLKVHGACTGINSHSKKSVVIACFFSIIAKFLQSF